MYEMGVVAQCTFYPFKDVCLDTCLLEICALQSAESWSSGPHVPPDSGVFA